jgi:hypothetical protein
MGPGHATLHARADAIAARRQSLDEIASLRIRLRSRPFLDHEDELRLCILAPICRHLRLAIASPFLSVSAPHDRAPRQADFHTSTTWRTAITMP